MAQSSKEAILSGKTFLGMELGSTRIKAVLIDENHVPIASGSHDWENRYESGVWTYHLEDIWAGIQDSYKKLAEQVQERYGVSLATVGAMGFSAMMHGYLPLNGEGALLVPFRTWRNTITAQAAEDLTELFGFNVPQRWSAAHLWQAILNGEAHVGEIRFLTTLAGYVHWKLTGRKVLGVGDASGMFPIDSETANYDRRMLVLFNKKLAERGISWTLEAILPEALSAGQEAGALTPEGAKLLDPSGTLQAGIPLCPPEGDAGTGMAATNSVAERTGNVSAGTSVFAMAVLEKPLSKVHPEIDIVTTPTGKPVAMVHCNNCTSDLNAWAGLFHELTAALGMEVRMPALLDLLFAKAAEGDADCGGLLAYNYDSGEPITGFEEGRPLFVRSPSGKFTLANFARTLLFSALGTLKIGMDILFCEEQVQLDRLLGHGGYFKAREGQRFMAGAMGVPVSVMETAGEGGAWGIALLAAYLARKTPEETLEAYLEKKVFAGNPGTRVIPEAGDIQGFATFLERYRKGLPIQKAAVDALR